MNNLNEVIVIAEAGVNHNGDINIAKKLIECAKEADADYVKFQTFKANELTTHQGELAEYQKRQVGDYKNQFEMLKKLELSKDDHIELIEHCRKVGINFLSTPFEIDSLRLLIELDAKLIKISSGDLTNYFLLKKTAESNLQTILSTGMGSLYEIEDAINCLTSNGLDKSKISLLHCTTEYPCPYSEVNLSVIKNLKKQFGVRVGYSDHTSGISVSIAAAALGACIIEKHFTLDKNMIGPDHQASLEPDELSQMVKEIRNITEAIGTGKKAPTKSEIKNMHIARKSLVANKAIKKGERFSGDNITAKRPGSGISPMKFLEIDQMIAKRDFSKDEQIDLD